MASRKYNCIEALVKAGISFDDATALRRISMTLSRWHELECGDGNEYGSWCITRGRKDHAPDCPVMFAIDSADHGRCNCKRSHFVYDDDGKPYLEHHHYMHGKGKDSVSYTPMPDREKGAKKRLDAIMARYPGWESYIQGDPRGCALYLMPPGEMASREPGWLSANYNRGIAVCK